MYRRCRSIWTLKKRWPPYDADKAFHWVQKVLIVLDQFEQWLHSKCKDRARSELGSRRLRQCDGGRVQCIVMVRDDFWLGVSRFLRELEVPLVEGRNIGLVDLFDLGHARKVLCAFGRAFARLPEKDSDSTTEANTFLKQAISGLAEDGKVICVRLALFAEMMKGKPWTPATLIEVGGTQGVGVTFLEETFSTSTASPEHRLHQKAARAVLKSLLPESGTDIKGNMRSYQQLLELSGYGNRPKEFEDLTRILDSEIRFITPTDPEGTLGDDDPQAAVDGGQKYYQLTHDYLVHSLRDWLTRKQRETRRGRAGAACRSCSLVEPEAREPASAVAVGVSQHPFAHRPQEVDLIGTKHDGHGGTGARHAIRSGLPGDRGGDRRRIGHQRSVSRELRRRPGANALRIRN